MGHFSTFSSCWYFSVLVGTFLITVMIQLNYLIKKTASCNEERIPSLTRSIEPNSSKGQSELAITWSWSWWWWIKWWWWLWRWWWESWSWSELWWWWIWGDEQSEVDDESLIKVTMMNKGWLPLLPMLWGWGTPPSWHSTSPGAPLSTYTENTMLWSVIIWMIKYDPI